MIEFEVAGIPVPQGSKQGFVIPPKGGVGRHRAVLVDDNAKTLLPWRQDVMAAAKAANTTNQPIHGACEVWLWFAFPRPAGHFGARGTLLPSAPWHMMVKPDVDKLARATLDALQASNVLINDSNVGMLIVVKDYNDVLGFGPGLRVQARERTLRPAWDVVEQGTLL